LGINIYHSVLARNEDVKKKGIQVYVCCPGYVKTDMSSHKGTLSIEEGIRTPVFLIESPFEVNKEWQGGFFYLSKHVSAFDA
jgi:NAD(P)-dependent dehydrogenase (short-subunit alcohol dehydrogenase family)